MAWQNILQLIGFMMVVVLIAPAVFRINWKSTATLFSIGCWLAIFVAVSLVIDLLLR